MTQDIDIIYEGVLLRVVAVRTNGRCPAREFLEERRTKHPRVYAEFAVRLRRLGDTGRLVNPEQLRRIQDGGDPPVYEVKAHTGKGWRLYGIQDGATWCLTHGRAKPKDNAVAAEAKKARRIYSDRST